MSDINTDYGEKINVAATCVGTFTLGPGYRSVVWVQGCLFNCPGCIAPGWIPVKTALLFDPKELANKLLQDTAVTGITISGGEPMLQAYGLVELVEALRARREVNILVYSGYTYETLLSKPPNPYVITFLSKIDGLIDGPYIDRLNDNRGMRGSSNQRFILLSDRLKNYNLEGSPRRVEVKVQNGQILIVGVPDKITLFSFKQFSSTIETQL